MQSSTKKAAYEELKVDLDSFWAWHCLCKILNTGIKNTVRTYPHKIARPIIPVYLVSNHRVWSEAPFEKPRKCIAFRPRLLIAQRS